VYDIDSYSRITLSSHEISGSSGKWGIKIGGYAGGSPYLPTGQRPRILGQLHTSVDSANFFITLGARKH
jgi:hypothetical protein